jgi:Protein of unknown function (DUF3370)
MLNFLAMPIAQVAPAPPASQYVIEEHPVRQLPGDLDNIPVFNSNSPEIVQNEGILLSTFSPQGRANSQVHLNYNFSGRFDVFTHHIARPSNGNARRLNLGVLVYNNSSEPVLLEVLQSLSYTTKDDAPFKLLPAYVNNPDGRFFSGPGSRLATDLLRGVSEPPSQIAIPAGQSRVIFNRPIPNGSARSSLMRLRSNGKVQVASIALFDRASQSSPSVRPPQEEDWNAALNTLPLATPRDLTPTKPQVGYYGSLVYGRVAGVSEGTRWEAVVTDPAPQGSEGQKAGGGYLSIPARGKAFSYVLNTPDSASLGTGQVQTAQLLVRYPDTAYDAHGNYTTHYHLTMPLQNNTSENQVVTIKIQTPLRDEFRRNSLRFKVVPTDRIFFRGTVRVTYPGDRSESVVRSVHVTQKQGERGQPLAAIKLAPGMRKQVEVDLIYPPDATPPQVLTVESFDPAQAPVPPAEQSESSTNLELAPTIASVLSAKFLIKRNWFRWVG